jgi:carboxyl-terminal processing protease
LKQFLIGLLLSVCVCVSLQAQPVNSDKLRQKCMVLRRFLEQKHYQPLQWNDSSASLLFDKWISELDGDKRYFTQADIKELNGYRYKLADEMLGKSWQFFDRSVYLYHLRLQQSDSILNSLLNKPVDFSRPDSIHFPFTSYASSLPMLAQRCQQVIKWRILHQIEDAESDSAHPFTEKTPANFAALESDAIDRIKKQHAAHMQDLLQTPSEFEKGMEEEYLRAITWCYDPHTEYMNVSNAKEFETEVSRFEYSAGIDVEKNDKGEWEVSRLVPGGNAWRNGDIHQGDILLKIKSGEHAEKELVDLNEEEVMALLQGASDEKLIITLRTSGGSQKTVALVKEKIDNDENIVKSFVLDNSKKIGYIKLPGFYSQPEEEEGNSNGCANDVAKEVVKLKEDSIQGLILDLRYNGGGSMWEAIQLAGIFIDVGPLCSTKDKDGTVHFMKDPNRGTIYDGPMIVMVNAQSASASELVSAVLQDYNRALIVGDTTYGKGSAQVVLPLDTTGTITEKDKPEDFVKVTEKKFYRVNGSTTQWKGVIPDINLPDIYVPVKYKERGNASALLPDNSKVAMYDALPPIPVAQLKQLSAARVNTDSSFLEVKKFSGWLQQYTTGIDVPLQWPAFFRFSKNVDEVYDILQRKEDKNGTLVKTGNNKFDAERIKLQDITGQQINQGYLQQIGKDYYIREAYNIMLDWINLQK